MQTNQNGINLIKSFEGCKLNAYNDIRGIPTIGYGHTGPEVHLGLTWTQEQADEALRKDLGKFEAGVSSCVTVQLNSNQFSALVCFSYNCGLGHLQSSTLLKNVNAGDFDGAKDQFLAWDKAGGTVVAGLLRRRQAEANLFSSEDSGSVIQSSKDQLPDGPSDSDIASQLESVEKQ